MKLQTPTLKPDEFVRKWQDTSLTERASYQLHFIDVCALVGAAPPQETDSSGLPYTFEYGLKKTDGRQGYADVFYSGHFAIEYKGRGKYKDLSDAYRQLQQYRENLNNPPLLIVCDIERWEIHTNFTNAPVTVITLNHADIGKTHNLNILRRIFTDPTSFHPEKNKLQITEDVAAKFRDVVDETVRLNNDPQRIARFMTRLVFCMFVEDIGLLPKRSYDGILTEIIRAATTRRELFPRYVAELFAAMAKGGNVQMLDILWFNGSMFSEGDNDVIPLGANALAALDAATDRDWAHVEPSIFGTIFERTLDEKKRGQLGAHYTHPDDIALIVEPVLMTPLRRLWDEAQREAEPIRERLRAADSTAARHSAESDLISIRGRVLERVRSIRVLDPACGSGNFLYISLRRLLDLEKEIITHPLWAGLPPETIRVHPTQLYGIEVNEIAHALASVVVWIGYLQWRQDNGFFETKEPILSTMSENIRRMDAILAYRDGVPVEPEWAAVDVIVGNPPFLGAKWMRGELGDKYTSELRALYKDRVPNTADLVMYWFEKSRAHIEQGKAKRAGLLATNTVQKGSSATILKRIEKTGNIFFMETDHRWRLPGASLRVSIIGFDNGAEKQTNAEIKSVTTFDVSAARSLSENELLCFRSGEKNGPFEIPQNTALEMLSSVNPTGANNSDVVLPYINAKDLLHTSRNLWLIDFGGMELSEAERYQVPLNYVRKHVKPVRDQNNRQSRRNKWWQHGEIMPSMRRSVSSLSRYIVTPLVSKYRIFAWMDAKVRADVRLVVFARQDDYFFGVLHSKLHETWALAHSGRHGVGNDPVYNKNTTFETFPFPYVPGKEDFTDPCIMAISSAARTLHEERHAWLNARDGADYKDRTLTHLYNALNAHRGKAGAKGIKAAAREFAPRLHDLHTALDRAVCAAYGWDAALLDDDEALLRALLHLNGARADAGRDAGGLNPAEGGTRS